MKTTFKDSVPERFASILAPERFHATYRVDDEYSRFKDVYLAPDPVTKKVETYADPQEAFKVALAWVNSHANTYLPGAEIDEDYSAMNAIWDDFNAAQDEKYAILDEAKTSHGTEY